MSINLIQEVPLIDVMGLKALAVELTYFIWLGSNATKVTLWDEDFAIKGDGDVWVGCDFLTNVDQDGNDMFVVWATDGAAPEHYVLKDDGDIIFNINDERVILGIFEGTIDHPDDVCQGCCRFQDGILVEKHIPCSQIDVSKVNLNDLSW